MSIDALTLEPRAKRAKGERYCEPVVYPDAGRSGHVAAPDGDRGGDVGVHTLAAWGLWARTMADAA